VSPTSAIEVLCVPRFDSPSVFARLLDRERGGVFAFTHGGREVAGRLEYVTNTNVLRTTFTAPSGSWEALDSGVVCRCRGSGRRRGGSAASVLPHARSDHRGPAVVRRRGVETIAHEP
jgi:hypothetical protein